MTQDKARKEAVRSYATERNLSYTQALASLRSHSNEPGNDQNPRALPTVEPAPARGAAPYASLGFTGTEGTSRPHAYIVGATGTGRTRLMRSLAHQAIQSQGIVKICDPKTGWADFVEQHQSDSLQIEHATTLESMAALIESARNQMRRRLSSVVSQGLQDDMDPYLLVLDEAQQILGVKSDDGGLQDTAVSQEALNNIGAILRQGRAVGIHLLFGSQSPIASLTSGELVDSLATWSAPYSSSRF
jgi:Cdc6-like AAA superfamily ATPase